MTEPVQCTVEGMTCGNCALTITTYLKKQGVEDAVANAATGELSFTLPEGKGKEELYEGIDRLGYKVHRESQDHQHSYSKVKILLIISAIFWLPLMAHMFVNWSVLHQPLLQCILATPVFLIGMWHFGSSAVRSIRNGIANMDVLVTIGTAAAYTYSIVGWYLHPDEAHNYLFFETAASVVTLVLAGNFLEEYAMRSTASSMRELMKYQKTKAKVIMIDSLGRESITETDNDNVRVGDLLQVNTGDKIPVDGILLEGYAAVDESMMTGESIPNRKEVSATLTGGTIVVEGNMRMQATAIGKQTALAQIIDLVNKAQAAKPPMQKLADRISAVFVPAVILIAVVTFIINYAMATYDFQSSMMRTIAVLVIACPCAMGLATPAAVMVGLGRAARKGILIKGGDTLEKLKDLQQFVFDKTGTLTTGKLEIDRYETTLQDEVFRRTVFSLEQFSSHPIAESIREHWHSNDTIQFSSTREIKGIGMQAEDRDGVEWKLGSYRVLNADPGGVRHDLYLLRNDVLAGWMDMKDELRSDAKDAIAHLHRNGYRTILLSGDRKEKCERIASALGIETVYAEHLPAEKMLKLEELMQQGNTAMVGDGINDAPSLAKAHVGISLSDASQIAMQSAQVILLKNNLSNLPQAILLGKHTYTTIKQNLFWAFFYNIVAIPVAAMGYLTPTWGAGIMALSDVVLVLNSLRLRYKRID